MDYWKSIQPFRDWVMAQTVVEGLASLDQDVVPVVAAAVGTHLPLVREFLCESGISTVTLGHSVLPIQALNDFNNKKRIFSNSSIEEMKLWQPPETWQGTTPIMRSLSSTLPPLPAQGSAVLRPTGPGISQILDIWLTNPGLF